MALIVNFSQIWRNLVFSREFSLIEVMQTKTWRISCVSAVVPNSTKVMEEEKRFRDCADLYQAGFHKNGVYTIHVNAQETKKVGSRDIMQPAFLCNVKISQLSSPLRSIFIVNLQGLTWFFKNIGFRFLCMS